jgi:hypothetical protein
MTASRISFDPPLSSFRLVAAASKIGSPPANGAGGYRQPIYLSDSSAPVQAPGGSRYCPILAVSDQQSAVSSKTRLAKPSEFEVLCG